MQRDDAVEPRRRQPPAAFGIAPPGSASRARRIDEHDVRLTCPVGKLGDFLIGIDAGELRSAYRLALGARSRILKSRPVRVGSEDDRRRFSRRQRERLPARTGAQVKDLLVRLGATGERDQLTAFVLNLDQITGKKAMYRANSENVGSNSSPR